MASCLGIHAFRGARGSSGMRRATPRGRRRFLLLKKIIGGK